jgi:hypothetical protein
MKPINVAVCMGLRVRSPYCSNESGLSRIEINCDVCTTGDARNSIYLGCSSAVHLQSSSKGHKVSRDYCCPTLAGWEHRGRGEATQGVD